MKKVIVSILLFAPLAIAGEVGNGGDAVVCKTTGGITVELLDSYEARVFRNWNLDLKGETTENKVSFALNRLQQIDPGRAAMYKEWAAAFMQEVSIGDFELLDIPDSEHIMIPRGCEIQQLIVQKDPTNSFDPRYYINKNLWQKMDTTQQAAGILHELVYREAKNSYHENSVSTRAFNGLLITDKINTITKCEYLRFASELRFFFSRFKFNYEIQGFQFVYTGNNDVSLHNTRNCAFKRAHVRSSPAYLEVSGQSLQIDSYMYFDEQQNLTAIQAAAGQKLKLNDFTYMLDKSSLALTKDRDFSNRVSVNACRNTEACVMRQGEEDFNVKEMQVTKGGRAYVIAGQVSVFENGDIKTARLGQDLTFTIDKRQYRVSYYYTQIGFHRNGNLKFIVGDTRIEEKRRKDYAKKLFFDENGRELSRE